MGFFSVSSRKRICFHISHWDALYDKRCRPYLTGVERCGSFFESFHVIYFHPFMIIPMGKLFKVQNLRHNILKNSRSLYKRTRDSAFVIMRQLQRLNKKTFFILLNLDALKFELLFWHLSIIFLHVLVAR